MCDYFIFQLLAFKSILSKRITSAIYSVKIRILVLYSALFLVEKYVNTLLLSMYVFIFTDIFHNYIPTF